MEERLRHRARIIYAGAGTSGRHAVQDGTELVPAFDWPEDRLLFLIAGGKDALWRSVEGVEDDLDQAAQFLAHHEVSANDVVIVVAASGTTPFAVAALRTAKRRGALTIGIANNVDTPILQESDCPVWLDTGSEVIAGSTRLKAGTAQKITLNALSSLLMIRLGKVYSGLMTDVRATNEKLLRRSERILRQLTGHNLIDARGALQRAGGNLKVAALLLKGFEPGEAERILTDSDGDCARLSPIFRSLAILKNAPAFHVQLGDLVLANEQGPMPPAAPATHATLKRAS